MNDYSQMSDQQINGLVMDVLSDGNQHHQNGIGDEIELLRQVNDVQFGEHVEYDEVYAKFNPCNNPADAWPIIETNGLSIYHFGKSDSRGAWGADSPAGRPFAYGGSGLRCAMIVFLQMQGSSNANPI